MAVDKCDQTNKTCAVPGQSTGLKHLQVTLLFQVFIGEWNERKEACFGNFGNLMCEHGTKWLSLVLCPCILNMTTQGPLVDPCSLFVHLSSFISETDCGLQWSILCVTTVSGKPGWECWRDDNPREGGIESVQSHHCNTWEQEYSNWGRNKISSDMSLALLSVWTRPMSWKLSTHVIHNLCKCKY